MTDYQKELRKFEARRKKIVALRKKGLSHQAIGDIMGVTKQTVAKRLKREGVA